MKLLDRALSLVGLERRADTFDTFWADFANLRNGSVTPSTAEGISAVYACVSAVSETIASLPLRRLSTDGHRPRESAGSSALPRSARSAQRPAKRPRIPRTDDRPHAAARQRLCADRAGQRRPGAATSPASPGSCPHPRTGERAHRLRGDGQRRQGPTPDDGRSVPSTAPLRRWRDRHQPDCPSAASPRTGERGSRTRPRHVQQRLEAAGRAEGTRTPEHATTPRHQGSLGDLQGRRDSGTR